MRSNIGSEKYSTIVIEHARRVARKQFENRDPAQIAVGNLFCSVLEFGPVPTSPTPSNCFERKLSINNLCFLLFFLCIRLFRGVFLFAFRSRSYVLALSTAPHAFATSQPLALALRLAGRGRAVRSCDESCPAPVSALSAGMYLTCAPMCAPRTAHRHSHPTAHALTHTRGGTSTW